MTQTCWRIIKNDEEHALAMARLIELASGDLHPETDAFHEFELLGLLIEHYESRAFPMDKPDPIEAIKFRMDQQGLTPADMKQYIGSASKVSEVLNYKRPLSLSMIKRLHSGLGIPADILLQDVNSVEWSPISYGAEDFAMAFGDKCKNILKNTQGIIRQNEFEEIANIKSSMHFKATSNPPEKILSNTVKLGGSIFPSFDTLQLSDFQRA
ncbi:type II toxin-antitoxin system HigA family antitoxin [Buttiauxella noackiae]|uniref:helix-turn-helix domain-containing protein n=1 Tax=Buttiauxella noackiae TaxID=82992 RepID=UPI0035A67BC9